MDMEIIIPGGVAVEAQFNGFVIRTDQPEGAGGMNSAPSPFDTFLASLGTCAGFFALKFCQERNLDHEGLKLSLATEKGSGKKKLDKITLSLHLPEGFPEKYREAIVRAIDQCAVKRVLLDPPSFETSIA